MRACRLVGRFGRGSFSLTAVRSFLLILGPCFCIVYNFLVAYPNLVILDFLESLGCVEFLGRLCFAFCDILNYSNFKL